MPKLDATPTTCRLVVSRPGNDHAVAARLLYLTLTGMLSWMALLEFRVFTFERPGVLGRTPPQGVPQGRGAPRFTTCLLYTSDAADD